MFIAGNIFIASDGQIYLGDFGVAATLIENGEAATGKRTFAGTPCWMAPEVMMQQGSYASPADIWSFGITAIELAKVRKKTLFLFCFVSLSFFLGPRSSCRLACDEGGDEGDEQPTSFFG